MPQTTPDYLVTCFEHFAEVCDGSSPLYAVLSQQVARDPEIRSLAGHGQERQPPSNLLFGAVQYLLLGGDRHELAEFYPSLDGRREPADAWPVFRDFCRRHEAEIIEIVATRRVQTNEVGRCGLLMPAFGLAGRIFERPLHVVEVGSSAGLHLVFDRYHYDYGTADVGEPTSPVRIRTELRGPAACPVPEEMPAIAGRVGMDIAPVDVTDEEETRWLQALIWADQTDRIEMHRAAVALAAENPPRLVAGDALDLVADVVADTPPGAVPCVFHSHAIAQMSKAWREEFAARLAAIGRDRDLARVSLEWIGDEPGPQLRLTTCRGGEPHAMHLASCHHHGRWMEWLAS